MKQMKVKTKATLYIGKSAIEFPIEFLTWPDDEITNIFELMRSCEKHAKLELSLKKKHLTVTPFPACFAENE